MRRFKNILACVDLESDAQPALDRAVLLSKSNAARLKVVAVHEGLPPWATLVLPAKARNWDQIVREQAEERLRALCAPLVDSGLPLETKLLSGLSYLATIQEAIVGNHDLVLKSLELESTLDKPMISSTDMHLLRKCPAPLWLIRKDASTPFRRILAAVDPLPEEADNSVNIKVLEMATSLARSENAKLVIVRAYETIGQTLQIDHPEDTEFSGYLDHIQMVRIKNDKEFIGRFASGPEQFDVRYLFGVPSTMIAEVAKNKNVDLIVMGTVAQGGITGKLMGRTAENVLRQTTCSFLGIKPEDFVCPL